VNLIKQLLLTIALLTSPTLAAPIVTYTTSGVFSSSGSALATFGSGTLTFVPGGGMVDLDLLNPSNGNLGTIVATGFSPTSMSAISGSLTLNILQTTPFAGSGAFVGTLSGSLLSNASSGMLLFSATSITLPGNVTYTISQPPAGFLVVPPTTNNGMTTLQGTISMPVSPATVPEPATFGLIGTALGVLGVMRRRASSPPRA